MSAVRLLLLEFSYKLVLLPENLFNLRMYQLIYLLKNCKTEVVSYCLQIL